MLNWLSQKKPALSFLLITLICLGCKKSRIIETIPEDDLIETQPAELRQVKKKINSAIGGYYAGIPANYENTSKKYPLILFIHGLGQMGNGKNELRLFGDDGIGKLLEKKTFPISFEVKGNSYSFIVMSPQFSRQGTSEEVIEYLNYVESNYRIDKERIYLSGLSAGGQLVTDVAGRNPHRFAAIVPMAGVTRNGDLKSHCEKMVAANLPAWIFHVVDDPMVSSADARNFASTYNGLNPLTPARLTIFPGFGHDAWTDALNPTYKEEGKNIYEWMLQFSR